MKMYLSVLLAATMVALAPAGPAQAADAAPASAGLDEAGQSGDAARLASVKSGFEQRFPGVDVSGVKATPFGGLYEIQIGMNLIYTDADVNFLLQGSLIDAKTREDLTAMRVAKLSEVAFDSLPLELAIKQVKGTGKHKMAIFEDPNCGYCKLLHKTLKEVDDTTIYTFLFPILSPDSETKARNVWCADDRARAWSDWIIGGKVPPTAECATPIAQTLALGKKLMVTGTPAIIFADGSRVSGALPLNALRQKLDSVQ